MHKWSAMCSWCTKCAQPAALCKKDAVFHKAKNARILLEGSAEAGPSAGREMDYQLLAQKHPIHGAAAVVANMCLSF